MKTRSGIAIGVSALLALSFLSCAVYQIRSFSRFFVVTAGIPLAQYEVAILHNETAKDPRPRVLPKMSHQIVPLLSDGSSANLTDEQATLRKSCLALNEDKEWEHILWTEPLARKFLGEHFPGYLKTYDALPLAERSDILRYFILQHYGGVFLDINVGCLQKLQALLYYPAFAMDNGDGGLSDRIIGAKAKHPFTHLITSIIDPESLDYDMPRLVTHHAKGRWFETAAWQRYHELPHGQAEPLHRISLDKRKSRIDASFYFITGPGATPAAWSNEAFGWVGGHLMMIFALGPMALGAFWIVILHFLEAANKKRHSGYIKMPA